MSIIVTHTTRARGGDHFEPEAALDPQEQRRMRGHLEQIDYATFAANRQVVGEALGPASLQMFERMAVATARARAHWVQEAIAMSAGAAPLNAEQAARLSALRSAYEELSEAYEALRRMVERGYLGYRAAGG